MAKRRPSGDGMLRKREDGRWEGRIVVGHKKNGDSIFHHVYAKTCIFRLHPATCTEKSCHSAGKNLPRYRISLPVITNIGKM